ncbi:MAG: hypothetical protein V4658_03555 [Bacteroidota bacterium]
MPLKFNLLLSFFLLFASGYLTAQSSQKTKDSICRFGPKYDEPRRKAIPFPAAILTDEYKLKEIKRAVPDSLRDPNNPKHWYYVYFYETEILDFNPKNDSIFTPEADKLQYKLKDTYFFDINGDGLLDIIHYPTYYMAMMLKDFDHYVVFLQTKDGYEWVHFSGFITNIKFSKKGIIKSMDTYKGACCNNEQCTFYHYTFDKKKNDLLLKKREDILTCQLKQH